jgi:hypothetical protein
VSAAQALLALSWGKPVQPVGGGTDTPLIVEIIQGCANRNLNIGWENNECLDWNDCDDDAGNGDCCIGAAADAVAFSAGRKGLFV